MASNNNNNQSMTLEQHSNNNSTQLLLSQTCLFEFIPSFQESQSKNEKHHSTSTILSLNCSKQTQFSIQFKFSWNPNQRTIKSPRHYSLFEFGSIILRLSFDTNNIHNGHLTVSLKFEFI